MSLIKKFKFSAIPNKLVNDTKLSWKAKGVYCYLASKPDGWQFYENEITNNASDGKDSTRTAIQELIDNGWLVRSDTYKRNEKGQNIGYDYQLLSKPKLEKPKFEKPKLGEPATNKTDLNKTDLNNTKSSTKVLLQPAVVGELKNTDFEFKPIGNSKLKQKTASRQEIDAIIGLFEKDVGVPMPKKQRIYATHLIRRYGYADARKMVMLSLQLQTDKFFPRISKPEQLWFKLSDVANYLKNYNERNSTGYVDLADPNNWDTSDYPKDLDISGAG